VATVDIHPAPSRQSLRSDSVTCQDTAGIPEHVTLTEAASAILLASGVSISHLNLLGRLTQRRNRRPVRLHRVDLGRIVKRHAVKTKVTQLADHIGTTLTLDAVLTATGLVGRLRSAGYTIVALTACELRSHARIEAHFDALGVPFSRVTNLKLPALCYIDDRAVAFWGDWRGSSDQILSRIAEMSRTPTVYWIADARETRTSIHVRTAADRSVAIRPW